MNFSKVIRFFWKQYALWESNDRDIEIEGMVVQNKKKSYY